MKKQFHIKAFLNNALANDLIVLACLSNGGKDITLSDMEAIVKVEKAKFPTITADIQVTVTGNKLLLDKGQECILEIEEREEFVLPCPTLERQFVRDTNHPQY